MTEHGKTDTPNVVDGKYTCDQVYWIPVDEGGAVVAGEEEYLVTEYLRFTVKAGLTVEEGDAHLTEILQKVFDMTLPEFKEAFGFEDD